MISDLGVLPLGGKLVSGVERFLPGVNASLDVHVGLAVVAIAAAADLDDDHVGALERLSDGLQAGHVLVSGFLVEENSAHSNHIPSNVQTIGSKISKETKSY